MSNVIRSTLESPVEDWSQAEKGKMASCGHHVMFLVLLVMDVADLVSDWLFFVDVFIVEPGLVYGPPDRAAVWALLAFSIVGSFTFVFEVVNLWWEKFRKNPWIDSDILSAVVIWIEDIPQIIISLTIALCREEPISIFQLSKAAVVLISILVRFIISSVKYCNRDEVRAHHHVKIKVIIMIGMILEGFCAGAVFFLTQTERGHDGGVSFKVPNTVLQEEFSDRSYFANVSVFLHHADLFDKGNLDKVKDDEIVNWIRMSSIYHLRHGDQQVVTFNLEYEYRSPDTLSFAVWEKLQTWTLSECYDINQQTAIVTQVNSLQCEQAGYFTNQSSFFVTFKYVPPESIFKRQVFGDIHFNMKQLVNGQCTQLNEFTDSVQSGIDRQIPLTLRYYQTSDTLQPQDTKHMIVQGSSQARFFRNEEQDLTDITKVWKTGWNNCDSTGSFSPNLYSDMELKCSRS